MPQASSSAAYLPQKSTIGRLTIGHVAINALRFTFRTLGVLAPRVASALAYRVFLKPPRPARPAWEERILESARRFDLAVDKSRVAMWIWGDLREPLVLLVHGWGGRGSQLGALVEPLRAAGFSVVTFDAPGHGNSSGRRSSLPEMEEALRAVAENVGPLAAVVAHSAGAAVAHAAFCRGLAAERLVYLAAGTDPLEFTREFGRQLGVAEEVLVGMRGRIENRFRVRLADYQVLDRADGQLTPLWLAHDRGDRETPFEGSRALAERWPAAQLMVTEGLGHRRLLRDPQVLRGVVSFLAESLYPAAVAV